MTVKDKGANRHSNLPFQGVSLKGCWLGEYRCFPHQVDRIYLFSIPPLLAFLNSPGCFMFFSQRQPEWCGGFLFFSIRSYKDDENEMLLCTASVVFMRF